MGDLLRLATAQAMVDLPEFSRCAECRLCCSNPSMPVYLTVDDRPHLPSLPPDATEFEVCGDCRFLEPGTGCAMSAAARPTECRAYPFFYLDGRIGLHDLCPLAPEIKRGLENGDSGWLRLRSLVRAEFERAIELDPAYADRSSDFWEDADDALRP